MKRSDEIGQFALELEAATGKARRLGLDVAVYLLELAASEVREAYVVQRYGEEPSSSATRPSRRKEMTAGR
ncbi:MAG: hypothetical protein ACT6XY_11930 [Phreatobacter sp.]|jgi:hypothetical protein|uniref:hypothetical protein n=1 Tax=Phreatobacter sp. TaxID=1966341 RepID=UPI0040364E9F